MMRNTQKKMFRCEIGPQGPSGLNLERFTQNFNVACFVVYVSLKPGGTRKLLRVGRGYTDEKVENPIFTGFF